MFKLLLRCCLLSILLESVAFAAEVEEFMVENSGDKGWGQVIVPLKQRMPFALKESGQNIDIRALGESSVLLWQVGFFGYLHVYEEAIILIKPKVGGERPLLLYVQRESFTFEGGRVEWSLSSNALSETEGLLLDAEYIDAQRARSDFGIVGWMGKRINTGKSSKDFALFRRAIFLDGWMSAIGRPPKAEELTALGFRGGK